MKLRPNNKSRGLRNPLTRELALLDSEELWGLFLEDMAVKRIQLGWGGEGVNL